MQYCRRLFQPAKNLGRLLHREQSSTCLQPIKMRKSSHSPGVNEETNPRQHDSHKMIYLCLNPPVPTYSAHSSPTIRIQIQCPLWFFLGFIPTEQPHLLLDAPPYKQKILSIRPQAVRKIPTVQELELQMVCISFRIIQLLYLIVFFGYFQV